ncbi:MAG: RecX family transcriptional regulator [Bacteroidetes bacterium]|nr:RecX family transcriptional regulator [Bacteroidota bacterium]
MMTPLEKIVRYCAYQDRSVYETRLKIRTLKVSKKEEEEIIARLIEEHFLDDARFAETYVRGKMNSKGWGIAKIKAGLFQKGVAESIIQTVIAEVDTSQLAENMDNEIMKWKRSHSLTSETKPKLIRFLFSKGYSFDQIMNKIEKL